MKDFSERLGVTQSSVTKLADGLVLRGLIERISISNDRRLILLRATERADRILRAGDVERARNVQAIWEAIVPSEREAVLLVRRHALSNRRNGPS